jgi:hypothetical protein
MGPAGGAECEREAGADKCGLGADPGVSAGERDEAWREYDGAVKDIEGQKDALLDRVEERLGQKVFDKELFTVRFEIV